MPGFDYLTREYMKRSPIRRKPSDYAREFASARSLVYRRSAMVCEGLELALRFNHDAARDLYAAVECEVHGRHVHHRKYRSRGGSNSLDNLVMLCGPCHAWAHAHGGFGEPANLVGLSLVAGELETL